MLSIRKVGGISLFLFGTTFLWLTPMFAAADVDTSGIAWAAVGILATATIVGFTVATWGLSSAPRGGRGQLPSRR